MGLWVEVDRDLPEHPKSLKLAEILGDQRAWTRVVQLWMWAVQYAPSGDLSGFTDSQIARAMGYDKGGPENGADPVQALRECGTKPDRGFLDSNNRLHGWRERTGGKLKQRQRVKSLNRVRQSRMRHALVTREKRTVPDLDLTVPDLTVPNQDLPHPPTPAPRRGRARCVDCPTILDELNRLKGSNYQASGKSGASLHARHAEHGVERCLEVVRHRHATAVTDQDRFYFRPSTLFRPDNFENELEAMRTGVGPPIEQSVKRREHLAESAIGRNPDPTEDDEWITIGDEKSQS